MSEMGEWKTYSRGCGTNENRYRLPSVPQAPVVQSALLLPCPLPIALVLQGVVLVVFWKTHGSSVIVISLFYHNTIYNHYKDTDQLGDLGDLEPFSMPSFLGLFRIKLSRKLALNQLVSVLLRVCMLEYRRAGEQHTF